MPGPTKAAQKQARAAEDSFNRTYSAQYGEERWSKSLYPALAAPTRYSLLVNQYAPLNAFRASFEPDSIERTHEKGGLDNLEGIELVEKARSGSHGVHDSASLVAYQWTGSGEGKPEREAEAEPPFPAPQLASIGNSASGLTTHWNLDAASLLAVRVLDPKPGDKLLDLCAAPGGKSIAMAQLMRTTTNEKSTFGGGCLHSNEFDNPRNKRLAANLSAYLPSSLFKAGEVKVLKLDGSDPNAVHELPLGMGGYDKALVDAPCSSERHIIHAHVRAQRSGRLADEMVSWRPGGSKKLAKTQAALLMTALKAVRAGGEVVYATCSLSNEENDGVIDRVLRMVQKDRAKGLLKWDFKLTSSNLEAFCLADWAERTSYGYIVLPDHRLGRRWGPLFFAVLEKVPL